jgi:hypothetical protein
MGAADFLSQPTQIRAPNASDEAYVGNLVHKTLLQPDWNGDIREKPYRAPK